MGRRSGTEEAAMTEAKPAADDPASIPGLPEFLARLEDFNRAGKIVEWGSHPSGLICYTENGRRRVVLAG